VNADGGGEADAGLKTRYRWPKLEETMAATVERIDPTIARADTAAGKALLVCGYEDDSKCRKGRLEGSIPLARFTSMASTLPKDKEIIFYCA
jgi:hypothetical protein